MPTEAPEIPTIESMSAQVTGDAMTSTPTFEAPKPEAKKETPPPTPNPEANPDAKKPDASKPESKKPEPKPEAKKEDADLGDDYKNSAEYKSPNSNSKLRKTLDRFAKERDEWKTKATEFETSGKTNAEKIAEYEAKIKTLESKPVETKTDTALIEKYEGEIKSLKQSLREYDYQKSDEFKEKYAQPFERAWTKAISQVKQLKVNKNDQQMQATEDDFKYLRSLPLGDRIEAAKSMFGSADSLVLSHISRLEELKESALEAIEAEKQNHELRSKETTAKQQKEREEYVNFLKQSEKEILETVEGFKFSDDPEEKKAWEKGLAFVEHALNNVGGLPANERAAHAAAVKMKAALYDLDQNRIKAFTAKLKSMEEELAKYRDSDPGSGGEKGKPEEKSSDIPTSIEDMLSKAPAGWSRNG